MKPCIFLRFAAFLICLAALVSLLFLAVRVTINDRGFFGREYARLDHARSMGMETQELTDATMRMIGYMEGTADSIDLTVTVDGQRVSMFNDRERAHMVDVRALYHGFRLFSYIAAAAFAALLVFAHRRRDAGPRVRVSTAFLHASAAFLLLALAAGAWVLVDFNSFWVSFHLLFFTNDLWILDPATSRMINMMPWQLFYDIVLRTLGLFAAAWAVCAVLALLRRKRGRAQ